jgi:hypothetical protein
MRAADAIKSRPARAAILVSILAGWAAVAIGAANDLPVLIVLGVVVIAGVSLVLAKLLLELGSTVTSLSVSSRRSQAILEQDLRLANREIDGLRSDVRRLTDEISVQRRSIEDTRAYSRTVSERLDRLQGDHQATKTASAGIAKAIDDIRARVAGLAGAHDITRAALVETRRLADRLGQRNREALPEGRLEAASTTDVDSPLLSIAIPSFNRPDALADLLASIESEMASVTAGLVEVFISDDASTDPEAIEIALAFAEKHPYAWLQIQPSNVGLERNVLASGRPCRGDYLLLVGNDDRLIPGALTTILDDIRSGDAPVLLYAKERINLDGSPRAGVAGSTPIDLPVGASHRFESFIEASLRQGLLSTFGFISSIVVRRGPFVAIDPTPYLDLTMYPQLFVMIEAFSQDPVHYRNVATVHHRTPTQSQKHAEALGRLEEEFMTGGNARLSRYLGTSLAAALQRVIDRGALDHATLSTMPENLMSDLPLIDWIRHNRSIDPAMDDRLDPSVVADADRFFAALTADAPGPTR